ncbi:MAG: malate dehydrogenase [Planctomycetota bacterium]|jgi:L-lactate dehydrogenase
MKVSIIGGGGRVGSCTAFALQCGGIVDEIVLLDANVDMAQGEALDLVHGASICADQRIYAADYPKVVDSDIVVITAGSRRKADESRLDLINRNVQLFLGILESLKQNKLKDDAIILVVSNPVDILTQLTVEGMGRRSDSIIGLGTVLDSTRFGSLIARDLNLPATQVKALILGEHGDSMVPIWSSATIGGLPLTKWPGMTQDRQNELFAKTKTSGADVIRQKGGAGWAVGLSVREVVETIALDKRRVLPVSTAQIGAYGIKKTCLSVPTILGRNGVVERVELELSPKEVGAMQASAAALDETFKKVSG